MVKKGVKVSENKKVGKSFFVISAVVLITLLLIYTLSISQENSSFSRVFRGTLTGQIINDTNLSDKIFSTSFNSTQVVTHDSIEIGKVVKWRVVISPVNLNETTVATIAGKFPSAAGNITFQKINLTTGSINTISLPINPLVSEHEAITVNNFNTAVNVVMALTGNVVKMAQGEFLDFVLDEEEVDANTQYIVTYYTSAPYLEEYSNVTNHKTIRVVGPSSVHYSDVLAYTSLPIEVTGASSIELIKSSGSVEYVSFKGIDKNNNGLYDTIEWVVPSLSEQTYDLTVISSEVVKSSSSSPELVSTPDLPSQPSLPGTISTPAPEVSPVPIKTARGFGGTSTSINQSIVINKSGIVGGDNILGDLIKFNVSVNGTPSLVLLRIWKGIHENSIVLVDTIVNPIAGNLWSVNVQSNSSFPTAGSANSCNQKGYGYGSGNCLVGVNYTIYSYYNIGAGNVLDDIINSSFVLRPDFYSLTPYIMSINETSEVIRFETNVLVNATINYGINSVNEYSISNTSFGKKNEFLITNLVPGTKYRYQVVISNVSNGLIYTDSFFNASFKTSKNNQDTYSFAVIGDSQLRGANDKGGLCGTNQTELAKVISAISSKGVDFVLFTGDIVEAYNGSFIACNQFDSYWAGFHNVTGDLRKQIPFIATNGNHENIDRGANASWQNYWVLPNNANGQNGLINETAYSWRYGNTLFMALNTIEVHDDLHYGNVTGEQFNWFNKTVSIPGYEHKFIFTHIPLAGDYSRNSLSSPDIGYPAGNPARSEMINNLMFSQGVTAVFAGHQHYYCRNISRFGSPTYFVVGAVGDYQHPLNCAGESGYNSSSVYTIINVTPSVISGTMYAIDDSVGKISSSGEILVDSYALNGTPKIFNSVVYNESWIEGGDVSQGDDAIFRANVSSSVSNILLTVWQGTIGTSQIIWQGFMNFFGGVWIRTVETNSSWMPYGTSASCINKGYDYGIGNCVVGVNYTLVANYGTTNPVTINSSLIVLGYNSTLCTVIFKPGIYDLEGNIYATKNCFIINSSDVIFEGNNHTIYIGGDYDAISILNSKNVTVKNVNIVGLSSENGVGINLYNVNNSLLKNNNFNTLNVGINLSGSSNLNSLETNNLEDTAASILDKHTSGINYLSYENIFGVINWTNNSLLSNITLNGDISLGAGKNIQINYNTIYVNVSAVDPKLNSSSNMTFKWSVFNGDYSSLSRKIMRDGKECTDCINYSSIGEITSLDYAECSQESFNTPFVNESICPLKYSGFGTYDAGSFSNFFDGDWNTSDSLPIGNPSTIKIKYYKPLVAINATWVIRDASGVYNFPLNESCFNFKKSSLELTIFTDWSNKQTVSCGEDILYVNKTNSFNLFEESIIWGVDRGTNYTFAVDVLGVPVFLPFTSTPINYSSNYSLGKIIYSESLIPLDGGWNMVAITTNSNVSGNKTIPIQTGWNLIGFSDSANLTTNDIYLNLSGNVTNFSRAARGGSVSAYLAYLDNGTYNYLGINSFGKPSSFEPNQGYWLYSYKPGNLTFKTNSGSPTNETYKWTDLQFTNCSANMAPAHCAGSYSCPYYGMGNDPATACPQGCTPIFRGSLGVICSVSTTCSNMFSDEESCSGYFGSQRGCYWDSGDAEKCTTVNFTTAYTAIEDGGFGWINDSQGISSFIYKVNPFNGSRTPQYLPVELDLDPDFEPWKGYFMYTNKPGISMVRQN